MNQYNIFQHGFNFYHKLTYNMESQTKETRIRIRNEAYNAALTSSIKKARFDDIIHNYIGNRKIYMLDVELIIVIGHAYEGPLNAKQIVPILRIASCVMMISILSYLCSEMTQGTMTPDMVRDLAMSLDYQPTSKQEDAYLSKVPFHQLAKKIIEKNYPQKKYGKMRISKETAEVLQLWVEDYLYKIIKNASIFNNDTYELDGYDLWRAIQEMPPVFHSPLPDATVDHFINTIFSKNHPSVIRARDKFIYSKHPSYWK